MCASFLGVGRTYEQRDETAGVGCGARQCSGGGPEGQFHLAGVAVAQTSNVSLFGQEQVAGAKVAEKLINAAGGVNGTPIKLVYQDAGGDENGAINASVPD